MSCLGPWFPPREKLPCSVLIFEVAVGKGGMSCRGHQTDKGEKASTCTLPAQTYYTPVPCLGGFVGSNVTTHDPSSLAVKPGSVAARGLT